MFTRKHSTTWKQFFVCMYFLQKAYIVQMWQSNNFYCFSLFINHTKILQKCGISILTCIFYFKAFHRYRIKRSIFQTQIFNRLLQNILIKMLICRQKTTANALAIFIIRNHQFFTFT